MVPLSSYQMDLKVEQEKIKKRKINIHTLTNIYLDFVNACPKGTQ